MIIIIFLNLFVLTCDNSNNDQEQTASNVREFTYFSILGIEGDINDQDITLELEFGTDVTALVADFEFKGKQVKIGETNQVSGVTENDFSEPVEYEIIAENNSSIFYTVLVIVPDMKDNGDGTVSVYSSGLTWLKCTVGQKWNSDKNDCTGFTFNDEHGASLLTFCNTGDNSCNGNVDKGILNGDGFSQIYNACSSIDSGNRSDWRVPTKDELKSIVFCSEGPSEFPLFPLPDYNTCVSGSKSPAIDETFFPNTVSYLYWTAESDSADDAWAILFDNGFTWTQSKNSSLAYVRCVASD
jgi:hypothetical protein